MIKGFISADKIEIKHRLIVSVEAQPKRGKTHFMLTAPAPIAVFNFDIGLEGVIEKFRDDKEIIVATHKPPSVYQGDDTMDWKRMWDDFFKQWCDVLKDPSVITIGVDTASEMWELLRMARFGKLAQIKPHHYAEVNSEFRNLIRMVDDGDKNLVLTHKVKKRYKGDSWDGGYERAGFSEVGHLTHVNARLTRATGDDIDDGIVLTVMECRQNTTVNDMEFTEGDSNCDFPSLASMIYDDNVEDWQ